MREILFKAKQIDTGEWVVGDLLQIKYNDGSRYCSMIPDFPVAVNYPVNPDTVCQYTGLTDKNGKKIFEGDIVEYGESNNRYSGKYPVVFETRGESAYFGIAISDIETWDFCLEVPGKIMGVIGNIFDNPELIGGKTE